MNITTYSKIRKFAFIVFSVGGASCISLIGGLGLEAIRERILPLVPLIIALPGLNTMVGDYAATIAAHAGDPTERHATKIQLMKAVGRVVWINVIGIIALSLFIAWRRGYIIEQVFLIKFVIFVAAIIIAVVAAMFAITVALDKALEKKRLNPDDILIPIVTTISDILMLGLIAIGTVLVF